MDAAGLPYERLNVGGIRGIVPWRALPNLVRFALAVPRAAAIVRRFRPQVVLIGGGYVCAPVAVAAWALGVPVVTLCVDVAPGWAVRLAARLSTRVAVAFPEAMARLPRACLTGYPVRREFLQADRGAARRRFGLRDGENVVLVFGGSLGARAINHAVRGALDQLLRATHVIHVTGHEAGGQPTAATSRPAAEGMAGRYLPFAYLDAAAMADALVAADLVICRAGAATLAELPVAGTPAVLVPGEFSSQERNAGMMADHGAAVVIRDRDLSAERLAAQTLALLADGPRLAAMAAACRGLAQADAAYRVAAMILEVSDHA